MLNNLFAYDSSWVGREQLITELSQRLHHSCRFLLILGLAGIGKTALAERLAIELPDLIEGDWDNKLLRANFDYREKATDFVTYATRWLESIGENVSQANQNPDLLLGQLTRILEDNAFLVLIDSLEGIFHTNGDGGQETFVDKYWKKFFLRLLSAKSCKSKLIVTSRYLPVNFHCEAARYNNFYQRHIIHGLDEPEQEALFKIEGFNMSHESEDRPILLRLGKACEGYPWGLRVIIEQINNHPFNGNVQAYWNLKDVNSEKEVQETIQEVENKSGECNNLHKLSYKFENSVYEGRFREVFDKLETEAPDAYNLICAVSTYRFPIQEKGWLMQLAALVKQLENQVCSRERQEQALDEIYYRFLLEESVNHNNKRVLRLHNLIRSIALERHKKLLQKLIKKQC